MLIAYLALALGVSFLCSILEAIILSVTTSYVKVKEMEGRSAAGHLKKLKQKIDRPLSAILTINTVAHTIGAAGVGAQAVAVFGEVYFGVISAVLTILILVFSEIIPKTIGARFWRELALPSARIITGMIYIAYPLVLMSDYITKFFAHREKKHTLSREELAALAHLGSKEGVLDESESIIIHNLMRLETFKVRSIMTPRTVVVSAQENMPLRQFIKQKPYLQHSRIPVYGDDTDHVTGYILNSDVLEALAQDQTDRTLKDLKRPIIIFHENTPVPTLFEALLLQREHIALIIDEYGGMQGVATMEDIIETMLGLEIVDERDVETDMQTLARKKWAMRKQQQRHNLMGGEEEVGD